tara:strand:+ start:114 stop:233 length:120 start_codon:yes stop_codon:yes gene_type:complete
VVVLVVEERLIQEMLEAVVVLEVIENLEEQLLDVMLYLH